MSETDTGTTSTTSTNDSNTDTSATADTGGSAEDVAAERLLASWLAESDDPSPATGDDGRGGKDAVLGDLARERGKRQTLEQQVSEMRTQHQGSLDAIAKALGLKEDEKPEPERLAEQLTDLQQRFAASEAERNKLAVAAAHGITDPADLQMLTATDPEGLKQQAEWVKTKNEAAHTPAFQPNPGQGQGGSPATLSEQLAAAEADGDRDKAMALKSQQLMELRNNVK